MKLCLGSGEEKQRLQSTYVPGTLLEAPQNASRLNPQGNPEEASSLPLTAAEPVAGRGYYRNNPGHRMSQRKSWFGSDVLGSSSHCAWLPQGWTWPCTLHTTRGGGERGGDGRDSGVQVRKKRPTEGRGRGTPRSSCDQSRWFIWLPLGRDIRHWAALAPSMDSHGH